ncbi:MAG TPA: polyprenyl synthetase family protein [Acidobacteriota bacterium]|jgi:geranylgeranyl pyrophosphate synthase
MQLPVLSLPKPVPILKSRPPHPGIPDTKRERDQILRVVRDFVRTHNLVTPLSLDELRSHTDVIVEGARLDETYKDYIAVLVNNEAWRETLAAIPYQRRLLLLPKCLRVEDQCPAPFDEFGLLCKQCGLCSIQDLQVEAERLGYAVLVAEGSPIVMSLIQTGKIDAIVGVSCLSVLERAFPYMEAAAVPGIAIPLLQDDCKDTTVDIDWVWDVIHLTSADKTRRMDLDALRREVDSWFSREVLSSILEPSGSATETISLDWLAKSGKRWRPFLTTCVFQAFQDDPEARIEDEFRKIAVAVECFHKASLVHDDIEDQDSLRYGEKTLHEEHGVPVALNVGDLLIGEGYRMIASSPAPPERKLEMLRVAAEGHRQLCLGQGAELCWMRNPAPLRSVEVLDIFRRKTAPAFEVALRLGAICAGADESVCKVLGEYSEALGIAYQIRDDLEDSQADAGNKKVFALRPSLLLAIAYERAAHEVKNTLELVWRRDPDLDLNPEEFQRILTDLKVRERAEQLLESYKEEAVRSLRALDNANIKGLLRRVIGKIFNVEIKGWCSEFEARNAAGRASGAATAV